MTADTANPTAGTADSPPRRKRATREGIVTSAARQKTIRVTIEFLVRHAKYGKYMRRRTVLHAHDEKNECQVGDKVELMECRPLSKTKRWRLVRIVQKSAKRKVVPV